MNESKQKARPRAMAAFSQNLSVNDFRAQLDRDAEQVGMTPGERYRLDGEWHRGEPLEKEDKDKVSYIGEWRQSPKGVRYPTCTFKTFRHGGQTVFYNGFEDVAALFRERQAKS